MYLAPENAQFNDIRIKYSEKYLKQLMDAGDFKIQLKQMNIF